MDATARAVVGAGFDGDVDPGIEGRRGDVGAEAAAHACLRLVADHPGLLGRLRAARIVGGYSVPHRDDQEPMDYVRYAVELSWPLREITRLVDALIAGRLIAQTMGPRPVLVLTRAGYRALEALEAGPPDA